MDNVEWTRRRLLDDAVEMHGADILGNIFSAIGIISRPAYQWEEIPIENIEDIRCEKGDPLLVNSTWKNMEEFNKHTDDYYNKHRDALRRQHGDR